MYYSINWLYFYIFLSTTLALPSSLPRRLDALLVKSRFCCIVEVLSLIRDKYLQIELFDRDEISLDMRLVLDIINQLKPAPGETLPPQLQQRWARQARLPRQSMFAFSQSSVVPYSCYNFYILLLYIWDWYRNILRRLIHWLLLVLSHSTPDCSRFNCNHKHAE